MDQKLTILTVAVLCGLISGCTQPEPIDGPSDPPATLRIDLLHSGSADAETYSVDGLRVEGAWPGPLDQTVDPFGYGPYLLEIRDDASGQITYSQGFASIFGEWQTTGEAQDTSRTFHESVRLPMPSGPVDIAIRKRDDNQAFQEVWHGTVDPSTAQPVEPNPAHSLWTLFEHGPPADKVDLLLLGDGYTVEEMEKWHADARRLTDTLFAYEPFRSRRQDFNVRAMDTPSTTTGIANPSAGLTHETPIGATYDSFGMERYILTFSNERWRDIAAAAPYEFVVIVTNGAKYGGAGIYNLFATVSADNAFSGYVFVHEFGHHFAGLGDEYYTSSVAYELDDSRPEPWSPNVTADPAEPKWIDLISPETPLPTPWPKAEYEALQAEMQNRRRALRSKGAPEPEIEALFREEQMRSRALFAEAEHAHTVGAFEGANYAATGYYRPEINCIMFTRDTKGFCQVCSRAIEQMITRYLPSTASP